jgi:hypothetical protein
MLALEGLRRYRRTFARGRVIRSVSERIKLVYFGSVDPRSDDHDSIRGITATTKHRDRHFAVGSYDGYDISLADRTYQPLHSTVKHTWCVLQVTLRNADIPYTLIIPTAHAEDFNGVARLHRNVIAAPLDEFPHEFTSRYTVYTSSHHAHSLHTLLPRDIALGSAVRLWPYAVEIHQNKLYVYISEHRLTETVLGGAIESALWLADAFDGQAAN